jgi:putative oxidoreductase
MSIMRLAEAGYRLLILVGDLFQHVLLLVFRLNWGWQLFINGKGKLANHGDIVDFFKSLNLPFPDFTAWFVGGVECLGGLALVAGFGSRAVGLILTINMTVAYLSVPDDRQKVFNILKEQDPFLQADPFFYLLTAIVVFVFGSGFFSVDQLLKSFVFEKKGSPAQADDQTIESKN